MDRFDMLILAWLAFLALSYPVHERWKRAIAASIEKRTVRCWQKSRSSGAVPSDYRNSAPNFRAVSI